MKSGATEESVTIKTSETLPLHYFQCQDDNYLFSDSLYTSFFRRHIQHQYLQRQPRVGVLPESFSRRFQALDEVPDLDRGKSAG